MLTGPYSIKQAQLCISPCPNLSKHPFTQFGAHRPTGRQIPQLRIGNSSSDDPHIFSRRKAPQIRRQERHEGQEGGRSKVARICLFALETLNLSLFPSGSARRLFRLGLSITPAAACCPLKLQLCSYTPHIESAKSASAAPPYFTSNDHLFDDPAPSSSRRRRRLRHATH